MDRNFGQWYSLADPKTDHDRNVSRWHGVETFCKLASIEDIIELSRLFYNYPNQKSEFVDDFQAAFQETDSTFPVEDNNFILSVLAGASLAHILKGGNQNLSLNAAYAIACPSFQKLRSNVVIPDIVHRSHEYLIKRSSSLRTAQNIKSIQSPKGVLNELSTKIINNMNESSLSEAAKEMSEYLNKLSSTLDRVVGNANSILSQQNLDREESDILWWASSQFSRDLNRPIKDFDLLFSCLIAGKELSDLTRVLPGPFAAQAFISKFLHDFTEDLNNLFSLKDFINSTSDEWRNEWFSKYKSIESVNLCPITSALLKSLDDPTTDGWLKPFFSMTGIKHNVKLTPLALAFQLYQEIHFLKSIEK